MDHSGVKADRLEKGEEEINLLDFMIVVLKRKWLILSILVAAFILINTVLYLRYRNERQSASQPPIHSVECVIRTSLDQSSFNNISKTRSFLNRVLEKEDTLHLLYPDLWNEKESKWLTDSQPSREEAYGKLRKAVTIRWNGGNIYLTIKGQDQRASKALLKLYVDELILYIRARHLLDLEQRKAMIDEVQKTIGEVKDPILRREFEKSMVIERIIALRLQEAGIHRQGNLIEILDPPYVIATVAKKEEVHFFSKGYFRAVAVGLTIAFILGAFMAFLMEHLQYLWQKYPAKVKQIKHLLK
ncbi:MAG: hypothetical protein JW902_15525 [Syntrophaceae bacterium]|nr:hypothetical protein [Syntrophaceae bacterium]